MEFVDMSMNQHDSTLDQLNPDQPSLESGAQLLDRLLCTLIELEASDLHLSPGNRPQFRISGGLKELDAFAAVLTEDIMLSVASELAGDSINDCMPSEGALDGAVTGGEDNQGRFRFNIFRRLPGFGIALRRLDSKFRSLSQLGLTESLLDWCDLPDGLVLVCGPTGSGKSTTLATMIDHINRSRAVHVITIEDPVEYLHVSNKALVDQRQIGSHASDFQAALVASLRQDPDVILVGEIRERDTIRTALTAAENWPPGICHRARTRLRRCHPTRGFCLPPR